MEVAQRGVFVVILYAVGENHVVSGVRPQRVFEFDNERLAIQSVLRWFGHGGRNEHIGGRVVQSNIFVKEDPDLFVVEAHGLVFG